MSSNERTSLQTGESSELGNAEATRPGPLLTPAVDIFEGERAITVLADMPGVVPGSLNIDLHEGVLTITGHVEETRGDSETDVLREYRTGTYRRQFTLSEAIDQAAIEARIVDGVLRLELPKAEKAMPRRIEVQTA